MTLPGTRPIAPGAIVVVSRVTRSKPTAPLVWYSGRGRVESMRWMEICIEEWKKLRSFPEHAIDILFESRQMLLNGIPHDDQVCMRVIMHNDISHTDDLFPWNAAVCISKILR